MAAAVGLSVILNHQNVTGRTGETPSWWPAQSEVALSTERPTLLMFAHPRCPCTRASMEELNRLLAKSGSRVSAHVLFLQPSALAEDWSESGLWESASAIPGVTASNDKDGAEARRFGAETSGFVVLYSARGKLLFKGGITAARGHAGDNAGASLIASLVAGERTTANHTSVYGCLLMNEQDAPRK
jgi:hypothetical protein